MNDEHFGILVEECDLNDDGAIEICEMEECVR